MMLKKLWISLILVGLTQAASLSAHAQALFAEEGVFEGITGNLILINDTHLKLSPTVKVYDDKGKVSKLGDLKKGDTIRAVVVKIDNRRLVDRINVFGETKENE